MEQLEFFDIMDGVKKPICPVCGNSFEKNKFNQIYCSKKCKTYMKYKKYRQKNKEKLNKKNKTRWKKYYEENKEKLRGKKRKYYEKNKEKSKQYQKKYNQNNKEKRKEICKKYYEENKEEIKEQTNKYRKKRKLTDKGFKLSCCFRSRITTALKRSGGKKAFSSMNLIGGTIQEAREYLEKQFKDGMTWENHGYNGWHIDHIIPCASFDLTDLEQQKKCFHYTNLQPLWAKENISKGAKII